MFKRNTLYTAIAAAALASLSADIIAQQTETSTATVTVRNTFDIDQRQAMSFGTLRATQSLQANTGSPAAGEAVANFADAAKLIIRTDGSANQVTPATVVSNAESAITEIVAGQPAIFDITNAAPFTTLNLIKIAAPGTANDGFFSSDTNLIDAFTMTTPGSSTSVFNVVIREEDVRVEGGNLLSSNDAQTDGNGAVSLVVGAALWMDKDAATIADGAYTGSFDLVVNY